MLYHEHNTNASPNTYLLGFWKMIFNIKKVPYNKHQL